MRILGLTIYHFTLSRARHPLGPNLGLPTPVQLDIVTYRKGDHVILLHRTVCFFRQRCLVAHGCAARSPRQHRQQLPAEAAKGRSRSRDSALSFGKTDTAFNTNMVGLRSVRQHCSLADEELQRSARLSGTEQYWQQGCYQHFSISLAQTPVCSLQTGSLRRRSTVSIRKDCTTVATTARVLLSCLLSTSGHGCNCQ